MAHEVWNTLYKQLLLVDNSQVITYNMCIRIIVVMHRTHDTAYVDQLSGTARGNEL